MRVLVLPCLAVLSLVSGCGKSSKPDATADKPVQSDRSEKKDRAGDPVKTDKPWRTDPLLVGRFHPDYPDDIQVTVQDGGPRLTKHVPESMWVRVTGQAGKAYRGTLLNKPHNLTSVREGDEILFLAGPKGIDPFRVTPKYMQERKRWHILPCRKCGMPELFDAPSDLIAVIFPKLTGRKDIEEMKFTCFCQLCGGVQLVSDKPIKGWDDRSHR